MDAQVIVIGAGPVGLMLAGELRLGGAEVLVVERLTAPTTESRASTLHARTMEILDQRGLLSRVGTPQQDLMGHFGGVPLNLGALPTRYPGQWKVPQAEVESLLATWATELGAEIRRGHRLVGLTKTDEQVRVEVDGPTGVTELTCSYLVGCDGEESTVRRLAGIEFRGSAATRELLRADVAGVDVPNRRFERLPHGLAIAARRPDGVTRVMVSAFDQPPAQRTAEPSFDEFCETWLRVTGEDICGGTPLWVNAFGNASRLARNYRVGRVLLAGDAAHQQMPAGGQAINLGLQDAVNLGWKLAAQVLGHAPAGLLDSYHDERHEVGRRVLRHIQAQARLLLGDSSVEPARSLLRELVTYPAVRNLLAGVISGLDVRYHNGGHPLVGSRVPDVELKTEDGSTSTVVLLRGGRGVLLDLSGDRDRHARLDTAIGEDLARWVDVVSAVPTAESQLGCFDMVLLRPDGYVAWAGSQRSDPIGPIRRYVSAGRPKR